MAPYSWTTGPTGYDDEDRVKNWSRTNGDSQSWNLSPVHDWTTTSINGAVQTRTHSPAHEILTMSGTGITPSPATLQHDTKGNMTVDDRGTGMAWDFDNMLQSFSANGVTGLSNATYENDAIGRPVAKNVALASGTATTLFVQAGQQVTCEYSPGNAVTDCNRKYAYGTYIDEVLNFVDAEAASEVRYWMHQNRQYSVYAMTETTGTAAEFYRYDLYGKHHSFSPSGTSLETTVTANHGVTFTGRRFLPESALISFRNRLFGPSSGRFLSRDRLQYVDGRNMYTGYFVPVGMDATGLLCSQCKAGEARKVSASGITYTNAGFVGDPTDHESLDLTQEELKLWIQVLEIFEALKGAKTKLEILGELIAEMAPDGVGEIDTDKITKAFDGIKDIIDLKNAFELRVWITLTGECCREGGFFAGYTNYWESHSFHEPCSTILPNPNRKGIDENQKRLDQKAVDDFLSGGGLRRCKEDALKAFDCSKKSNKKALSDPDDDLMIE